MLLVKTYIGKSEISGIGLFAAEPIKKGQAIWRWDEKGGDWKVSADRFKDRRFDYAKEENAKILHYGYTDNGYYKVCGDDAKYMNHSPNPNTESGDTDFDEIEIASKDISVGEEITCDYFRINDDYSREIFKTLERPKKK